MHRSFLRHRLALILFCSILSFVASFAQRSTLRLRVSQSDSSSLAVLDTAGIRYLSLNDFCRGAHLPLVGNDSTGKVEFLLDSNLVKFSAGNPFVVITERTTNNASVYQMPVGAVRSRAAFFVPFGVFVQIFNQISAVDISVANDSTLALGTPEVEGYDITGLTVEKKINGFLITVLSRKKIPEFEKWMKPDGWLFVTIPNAKADTQALQETKPVGPLKKVLVFQSPTAVQLTMRVSTDVEQAEVANDIQTNNLLISLRTQSEFERKVEEKKRKEAARGELEKTRSRWKMDVIVIDAGHGGRDPGAIGVTRTKEKDVTLGIALKLGALIEKNLKGVKVVYTRKTDKFVELYRRTQIANEAGGKLFISIHCNSMDRKPSSTNGFEIYLLRPGKTEAAIAVASRENAVIQFEENAEQRYKQLTEEEFIIVTMHQSSYVKYSEQFAEMAAAAMQKQLRQKNSGVKQAGFYVLVGASMPNVLIETGYLSNKREEAVLKSKEGQRKIAEAIFRGIKDYKETYEATLQEGKATSAK